MVNSKKFSENREWARMLNKEIEVKTPLGIKKGKLIDFEDNYLTIQYILSEEPFVLQDLKIQKNSCTNIDSFQESKIGSTCP
jgi:hypothetical protein